LSYRTARNFRKVLRAKPPSMQAAVARTILKLESDMPPPGLRIKPVKAAPGVYEARIDRSNRITFHWEDGVRVLRNNCHHDIIERNP
jgi:hypothetical protein